MKNVFIGIVFLIGSIVGAWSATFVSEELVYKIPSEYLSFGRAREIQAGAKIYSGERPQNGKVLYITGGSAGYASVNEHSLEEKLTDRLGVPVTVHVIATASQSVVESFAMVEKFPKNPLEEQAYVLMTWSGHRVSSDPDRTLNLSLQRKRILLRYDATRDLILNGGLLNESFMSNSEGAITDPKKYIAAIDKEFTASVASHWMKSFLHDKLKKLNRKRVPKNIFLQPDVFLKTEYGAARQKRVKRAYKNPKVRARYERNHKRYHDILLRNVSKLKPDTARHSKDFALYFIEQSKLMADKKKYTFGTLELPLNTVVHNDTVINKHRTAFSEELQALSRQKDFSNYYLVDEIAELGPFENWYDSGHMSPVGRKVYEKYYLDALVKFMTNGSDGVYGIEPGPEPIQPETLPE